MEKIKSSIKKILVIVPLILLVLVIMQIGRNYVIIKSLKEKLDQYLESNNYYIRKAISTYNTYRVFDMYKKDNKGKLIENSFSLEDFKDIERITMFEDKVVTYEDFDGNKKIDENSTVAEVVILNPYSLYSKDSEVNILDELFKTSIKSIDYNGRPCYLINNSLKNEGMLVEKSTGLLVKLYKGFIELDNGNKVETEYRYYYEFDKVTDNDIKEPNRLDYMQNQ